MTHYIDRHRVEDIGGDLFDLPAELEANSQLVHAAVVVIGSKGVLLNGATASGKSLLQRLLRERAASLGLFSTLVSDDYIRIARPKSAHETAPLMAFAPIATMDRQEVHGVGVLSLGTSLADHAAISPVCLHMWVDLVDEEEIKRSPNRSDRQFEILDGQVSHLIVPCRQALRAADMIFAALSTC